MAQDGPQQAKRVERIAKALAAQFDQTRLRIARQIAQAQEGHLIEQTEMTIFEELNRLKTRSQEVGLQERIQEAQEAFSPSGQAREMAEQGDRRHQSPDDQRAGEVADSAMARAPRRESASRPRVAGLGRRPAQRGLPTHGLPAGSGGQQQLCLPGPAFEGSGHGTGEPGEAAPGGRS